MLDWWVLNHAIHSIAVGELRNSNKNSRLRYTANGMGHAGKRIDLRKDLLVEG